MTRHCLKFIPHFQVSVHHRLTTYIVIANKRRQRNRMDVNPFALALLVHGKLHGTSRNTLGICEGQDLIGYKYIYYAKNCYRSLPTSSMNLASAVRSTWSEAPVQMVRLRGKGFRFSIWKTGSLQNLFNFKSYSSEIIVSFYIFYDCETHIEEKFADSVNRINSKGSPVGRHITISWIIQYY